MEKSESITALAGALAKAQSQFPPIERTEKVDYATRSNAKIKYSYAPLSEIIKACKKALGENELSVVQAIHSEDGRVIIETMLAHSSGEWLSSSYNIVGQASDPQTMGSLITYGRRYGLSGMLNIAADEDDDAKNVPESKPVDKTEHWCAEHNTAFFKRGKMKSYAHPIGDTGTWCYERTPSDWKEPKPNAKQAEKDIAELWEGGEPTPEAPGQPTEAGEVVYGSFDWITQTLGIIRWTEKTAKSWLRSQFKVDVEGKLDDILASLDAEKLDAFLTHIGSMREVA